MNINRPAYNTNGLPASVIARVTAKAAESWCYVTPDNRTFYITESQAKAMQAREGGTVYAPETQA